MTWRSTFFKSLPKARFFPVIGFPHRKYVPRVATRRPNHDHHPSAQQTHGDNPGLTIVPAFVGDIQGVAGEYLGGVGEIETAVPQRARPLRRIERDLHRIIVVTNKTGSRSAAENRRAPAVLRSLAKACLDRPSRLEPATRRKWDEAIAAI